MSSRADCEARHALGASPEEVLPAVFDAMAGAVGANEELVKKKTMYIKFGCRCVSARAHARARTPHHTHTTHTHTPLLPPTRRSHLGPGMRSVELSGCSEVPALTPARAHAQRRLARAQAPRLGPQQAGRDRPLPAQEPAVGRRGVVMRRARGKGWHGARNAPVSPPASSPQPSRARAPSSNARGCAVLAVVVRERPQARPRARARPRSRRSRTAGAMAPRSLRFFMAAARAHARATSALSRSVRHSVLSSSTSSTSASSASRSTTSPTTHACG